MGKINVDALGKVGAHPFAREVSHVGGASRTFTLVGVTLGLAATFAFNYAVTAATPSSTPKTMTPEWAAATVAYRAKQKMDPISSFETAKSSKGH